MFDLIAETWNDGFAGKTLLALIIMVIALFGIAIYKADTDEKKWQVFSKTHQCKLVGHITGDTRLATGVGITADGKIGSVTTIESTPDKNGYACDDGVTYWR